MFAKAELQLSTSASRRRQRERAGRLPSTALCQIMSARITARHADRIIEHLDWTLKQMITMHCSRDRRFAGHSNWTAVAVPPSPILTLQNWLCRI